MRRRFLMQSAMLTALAWRQVSHAESTPAAYPRVVRRRLQFPRDYGAHPLYRTEWWYLTAWLDRGPEFGPMGLQYTFFRSRTGHSDANPSRFAPRQLLFAHLALALPEEGRLVHFDRVARVGPAGVAFSTETTGLYLDGWTFSRDSQHVYRGVAETPLLHLEFEAKAGPLPVLRGDRGFSVKGPSADLASHYYSATHLPISVSCSQPRSALGAITAPFWCGKAQGLAWLDHEWSSSLLAPGAVGWDWIGIHLLDGGSLMAFRIRRSDGRALWQVWDWRDGAGNPVSVARDPQGSAQVQWQAQHYWQSERSGARYPVAFEIVLGTRRLTLSSMMADQEVDARASTGGFYWEGAVVLEESGRTLGRGYLELTGYAAPLAL